MTQPQPTKICEICLHEGKDVQERPYFDGKKDSTRYECDDIWKCLERAKLIVRK